MKKIILLTIALISSSLIFAQNNVGIGTLTPNANAILDMQADDKGVLVPRLTKVERTALNLGFGAAETGMLVFDTNDTIFYFWDGTAWIAIGGSSINTDDQTLTLSNDTLFIEDGNFVVITDDVNDADFDPTNELQNISIVGDSLLISGGTSIALSDITTTTISNDSLLIINGDTINLAAAASGTDDQNLTLSNDTLFIEDGNFIVLPSGVVSADDQALSISGDTLLLEDGGFVLLQNLTTSNLFNDSVLVINGDTVNLSTNDADFDPTNELQDISVVGDSLLISGGTSIALSDITTTTISNDSLLIINGDTINLTAAAVGSDDQTLSILGDQLTIADGNTITLPDNVNDADADATNELQDMSVVGDSILISGGTSIFLGDVTNTSIANDSLLIINGDTVNIAGASSGTDDQALTISNDTIFLEDGGFVELPSGSIHNTLDQAYDQGGPGVGREILATDGAVLVNGTDGLYVSGTLSAGSAIELSGAGTRMFFNPRLAAFRAGNVNGTQWDLANVGIYSFAGGFNNTASGDGAVAIGRNNIASGTASVALGGTNTASGGQSTALGNTTLATGLRAFTTGFATQASGNESTAMGNTTTASGNNSFAFGINTNATNESSTALGQNTISSGFFSVASGDSTVASQYATTAMGIRTEASGSAAVSSGFETVASGIYSNASGNATTASGFGSVASGTNTIASGSYATASGNGTQATGDNSTAMGVNSQATGNTSTAIGSNTIASGGSSLAIGNGSEASGDISFATGLNTVSSGYASTAIGRENVSSGNHAFTSGIGLVGQAYNEIALGMYNDTVLAVNNPLGFDGGDRIFNVGHGASDATRSNALTILKNGNSGFGNDANNPTNLLHLNNGAIDPLRIENLDTDATLDTILTLDSLGVVHKASISDLALGGEFRSIGGLVQNTTDLVNDDFIFGSNSIDNVGGAQDVKMFFYKGNGSFRAGRVSSANWDIDSLGTRSFAVGFNTKATGTYSLATGYESISTNTASTAMGYQTNATGPSSTALGYGSTASGSSSIATGFGTTASGLRSTAMGEGSEASGSISTALGFNTTASGSSSTATGSASVASGNLSFVSGDRSIATGYTSAAFGRESVSQGNHGFVAGYGLVGKSSSESVLGVFNDTLLVGGVTLTDRLFTIGNGVNATNRSTAMVVLRNGFVGMGRTTPQANLHVESQNLVGDAEVIIEADRDNNNEQDNPVLTFIQDGGLITAAVGLEGNAGTKATNTIGNALVIESSTTVQVVTGGAVRTTVAAGGNVGIGNEAPTQRLDVTGAVHISQETTTPVPNVVYGNSMPLAYGLFDPVGTQVSTYGVVSVTNTATGQYTVVIDNAWVGQPTIVANLYDLGNVGFINCFGNANTNTFTIYTYNASGVLANRQTSFVVHGTPQ